MALSGPAERIATAFDGLSPQLQVAARFVLDHPEDVALLSMREQARRAGVPPVTMTRLARRLGFRDYQDFRERHARLLRRAGYAPIDFGARASRMQQRQRKEGGGGLAAKIGRSVAQQIANGHDQGAIEEFIAAAKRIEKGKRVYFVGARSCYSVAFHAHYIYGLFRDNGELVDGSGGTGGDVLRRARRGDVLLAIGVAPYAATTVERVRYAAASHVGVVAITDSRVSPLAQIARECLCVPTETPSFFHAIAPAFAAAETLIALVAARSGKRALAAIQEAEAQLAAFGAFWSPPRGRRKRTST